MLGSGAGTVVFTGATTSVRGRGGASGESPDRDAEGYLDPAAIVEEYWRLVEQDRSAWTLELDLDLRPHVEAF